MPRKTLDAIDIELLRLLYQQSLISVTKGDGTRQYRPAARHIIDLRRAPSSIDPKLDSEQLVESC